MIACYHKDFNIYEYRYIPIFSIDISICQMSNQRQLYMTCMHASNRTYIHTHTHIRIHTYVHTCVYTCLQMYVHTYIQLVNFKYLNNSLCTHTNRQADGRTDGRTYTHKQIHQNFRLAYSAPRDKNHSKVLVVCILSPLRYWPNSLSVRFGKQCKAKHKAQSHNQIFRSSEMQFDTKQKAERQIEQNKMKQTNCCL